jgi:hypothetical protein
MLTRRAVLVTLAIGACGLLFYPFQSTVTDAWLITATNTDGHPVAGCRIEQHWEWRVVGLKDLAVETTDVAGHASFPRRTVRASLAQRMTGGLANISVHGPASGRSVEFVGCDAKNRRAQLGIHQVGDTMMYVHQVPTVWRDSSMLK